MDSLAQNLNLSQFQLIIAALGVLGLLLALLSVVLARSRRRPSVDELPSQTAESAPQTPPTEKISAPVSQPLSLWWKALAKTRAKFFSAGSAEISAVKDSLEEACIVSDLGVTNTNEALSLVDWSQVSSAPENERIENARSQLAGVIRPWLSASQIKGSEAWLSVPPSSTPFVIWFVGVNGVGKTTSIAKLAAELKNRGASVLLAAGDTFRAAAGEQLEIWANRLGIPCVRGQDGADSSAVLFDAVQAAQARKIDFVLCDSAGRLHNQGQLMEALKKNRRVLEKAMPGAPHEVLLVLDANTGQNMISQAEIFLASVQVTGLILTKLDGTAKGGAIVAVARKTGLPIRRLGLGETAADFVSFDADQFAEALLGTAQSRN